MRGQASITQSNLDVNRYDLNTLIADQTKSPLDAEVGFGFSHLGPGNINKGGSATEESFAKRDDVFIHYYNENAAPTQGKLSLNYGQNQFTHSNPKFGPEVGLGWTLGDADKNPIFLVKAGYGGKSLSTDFRPPSSDCVPLGVYNCDSSTPSWTGNCCKFGEHYGITLDRFKASLSKIEAGDFDALIPGFSSRGYELAGFFYHQGFNDVIDSPKVYEHEALLKLYMSDMRSEQHGLNATDLPIVIGQLGMHGLEQYWNGENWNTRVRDFRTAQANACAATTNAQLAETAKYMYPPVGHYHYYDRADTIVAKGISMAEAMISMVYPQQAENPF